MFRAKPINSDRSIGAPSFIFKRSLRPTSSSAVRAPSFAMISRSCSAMKRMNRSTYSGLPAKRLRSWGSWVATPKGQVPSWHTRIMRQPSVISGAVAKPNSSAPSSSATATSWPDISLPSVSSVTVWRSRLRQSTWCVSARPSSQGRPAWWTLDIGAAPVPPSPPEISMPPAPAFATPLAMVPTPVDDTNLTVIFASSLAHCRS